MSTYDQLLKQSFGTVVDLIAYHAKHQPSKIALIDGKATIDYSELNKRIIKFSEFLVTKGLHPQDCIAICASTSIEYVIAFLGALKIGIVVAPLAPSSSPNSLEAMVKNSESKLFFYDSDTSLLLQSIKLPLDVKAINLAQLSEFAEQFSSEKTQTVKIKPNWAFNIIYSSGTTGEPKGIVQPHSMRWAHVQRGLDSGYSTSSVVMISTPLYSNTTLVSFFPGIALGGTLVLIKKFNALEFLKLAEEHRATHAMLVPVQYQRIMALDRFDEFDLSSFQNKFCTSAPFRASLKADILKRWPGGLTEYYGMTEGGGTVILNAHLNPNKLDTVGQPAATSDIRLIDENGVEVQVGEIGEVVGRSPAMMKEYFKDPVKTRDAEWFSPEGLRFIRTGDIGRFDADGFLSLMDRKKDMIISGGFNIYPSDLESIINSHPLVLESAVIGVPSDQWGETPVAYVVLKSQDLTLNPDVIKGWVNEQVGKIQRLSDVRLITEIPRSHIGKILKRELQIRWNKDILDS